MSDSREALFLLGPGRLGRRGIGNEDGDGQGAEQRERECSHTRPREPGCANARCYPGAHVSSCFVGCGVGKDMGVVDLLGEW